MKFIKVQIEGGKHALIQTKHIVGIIPKTEDACTLFLSTEMDDTLTVLHSLEVLENGLENIAGDRTIWSFIK